MLRRGAPSSTPGSGTADHFLLSVLCDQQAGESYAVQRAKKLDQWVSMKTKAAGGGRGRVTFGSKIFQLLWNS